jgi:general secretion pathway protein H
MTSGQEVLFAVNIDRHSYQLVGDTRSRAIPAALGINVFTATNEITGDRVAQIRFYPDGTATGGRVRLSNKNQSSDIIVNWLTGGVEVKDVLEK